MFKLILRRLLTLPIVIVAITFITFAVGYLAPGDPILTMMGARHDDVLYTRLRHLYGLDLPFHEQYLTFLGGLARGDLGLSFRFQGRPVWTLIKDGVPVSVGLGGLALLLSVVIGIPTGVLAALRQNKWPDRASMALMVAFYAVPSFVLIPIFQWLNYQAFRRGWPSLPPAGWGTPAHLVLPVIVLSAASMGYVARLTRSTMLDTLRQDYIRTAYAKGLHNRAVNWRHAFRNALLPVITVLGPAVAFLVTGAFVVENLFAIPGIGFLSVQAIQQRDYPVIQGTTVLLATTILIMNLAVDVLYLMLDPRVHVEG
jgi:ABC-type dipeptide/oligopeptide/nickel transport system permease component